MRSNAETVGFALETLTAELGPYIERELARVRGESWEEHVSRGVPRTADEASDGTRFVWDAHSVLLLMWDQWNDVFRQKLGFTERSLVSELREVRNRWAHQEQFDFDDTYRCLDSVSRLLRAVSDEENKPIEEQKQDVLQARFAEREDLETRRAQVSRRRWQSVMVYAACGVLLVIALFAQFGEGAWSAAALVVITYGYFSVRALNESRVLLGPHECPSCRKIIYTQPCPYCGYG